VTASIFTYDGGVPRYLGLWLVLTPVLAVGLAALGVRGHAVVAAVLATLPSLSRNPPSWFVPPLRSWVLGAAYLYLAIWLIARVRARDDVATAPRAVDRRAVLALVAVALALRVPLAWWDPGISQIGTSTELAAKQLLNGHNPYAEPNPLADYGTYQYPAGTLLLNTPAVAAVPRSVAGEEHIGIRLVLWLNEALAVVLLAWAGARFGRARAGLAAAFAYAVGPTLVRESGMTVANDLVMALLVTAAAVALASRRPTAARALIGLAIAVERSATLVLPILWLVAGPAAVALGVGVPVVLQLPFLVAGHPGLHEVRAIVEPATRRESLAILRADSMWWPVYRAFGNGSGVLRAVALVGLAVAAAAAVWAGLELRRRGVTLSRTAAAFALPLFVAFAMASVQRTNYQDWYLTPFLLCVGLTVVARLRVPEAV